MQLYGRMDVGVALRMSGKEGRVSCVHGQARGRQARGRVSHQEGAGSRRRR